MRHFKDLWFILMLFFFGNAYGVTLNDHQFSLKSPDGRLSFHLNFSEGSKDNVLTYTVTFNNKEVIKTSDLGIDSEKMYIHQDLKMEKIQRNSVDEVWHPVYGERNAIRNKYNEITFPFVNRNNPRESIQLLVRAYNEGIAFRYNFPESEDGGNYIHIKEEHTQFHLPNGTKGYYTHRAQSEYHLLSVNEFPDECERPLTMVLPNGIWLSLTEANLVNFSRMKFKKDKQKENTLISSLYGSVDEITPFSTPWRVVMVAEHPGQLWQNNDLILNLNPPCKIEDPSWIKPGTVMREVTLSNSGAKKLVDFAVEQELDYIHFDAGWYGYEYVSTSDATTVTVDPRRNPKKDLDLQEAIKYAKSKGVGVIVYVNQRALAAQLDSILPLYKSWGIDGIKFGFVHVGSHHWTNWLHNAVKKCADHQLIVNIHDEYRPTGFSRTYPNLLTQEGIRGNEEFPDAIHNTILPFTRFVAGAADYTFCFNIDDIRPGKRKTTKAHQLALPVVYYSPLQYLYWYGKPENYSDRQEIEFWKGIPTTWDESRFLFGQPGKCVAIGRRKGETWYIGIITNNESREIDISLDFIPSGGTYKFSQYRDHIDADKNAVIKEKGTVTSKSVLSFSIPASGGVALKLSPVH